MLMRARGRWNETKRQSDMKKFTVWMLSLLFLPLMAQANGYTTLWKQVEQWQAKGQPRSAINTLQKIVTKAKAEKSYGNLLKAQLSLMAAWDEISPDSLASQLQSFKVSAQRAAQNDKALAAVYNCLLYKGYYEAHRWNRDSMAVANRYKLLAMTNPAVLAGTKAADYVPLLVEGVDSKYFNNDLLHVIGMEVGDYATLHRWYDAHDNRSAACYVALQLLRQTENNASSLARKSVYLQRLDSLISRYGDLPIAGELAIARYEFMDGANDVPAREKMSYLNYALQKWGEWPRMNVLRNKQSRLTLPSFLVNFGKREIRPGVKHQIKVMQITNIPSLTMTVTRLRLTEGTKLNPENTKDYAVLQRLLLPETAVSQTHRYVGNAPYKVVADSMTLAPLKQGVYLIEFKTEDKDVAPARGLLHVSNLRVLALELPKDQMRLVAVNATTGNPVPGAKISVDIVSSNGANKDRKLVLTADKKGEAMLQYGKNDYVSGYRAFTNDDNFALTTLDNSYYSEGESYEDKGKDAYKEECYMVFTDRKIYRPGQQVQVSVVAFTRDDKAKKAHVDAQKEVILSLENDEGDAVKVLTLHTDAYGTAQATIDLPKEGKTGEYSLSANDGDSYTIVVDEYKRPNFYVAFTPYKQHYADGDTIRIEGVAKSYAGVPVQHAKVKYEATLRPNYFWWRVASRMAKDVLKDTVETDAEGRFSFLLPLHLPESETTLPRYYNYELHATVTDQAGESHEADMQLPLSNRKGVFRFAMAERIERDSLKPITFQYLNLAGEKVDATVNYQLDNTRYTVAANKPVTLPLSTLKNGKHTIEAVCEGDTLRRSFVLFDVKDKTMVADTPDWFYSSATQFPADGKPVYVQVGSRDPQVMVYYSMLAGDKVLESGQLSLSNEVKTRALTYQDAYKDGLRLVYAWVKNGVLYRHETTIRRPMPMMDLQLKWTTFRNRLMPGQQETWTLHVSDKHGKPVQAQLVATLYDASLDAFSQHTWDTGINFQLDTPSSMWNNLWSPQMSFYSERPFWPLRVNALQFTHIGDFNGFDMQNRARLYGARAAKVFVAPVPKYDMEVKEERAALSEVVVTGYAEQKVSLTGSVSGVQVTSEQRKPVASAASVRKNLHETAFFFPALMADGKGNFTLKFTLPESVTTWNFLGYAHDKDMQSAVIAGVTEAKKDVMIMPNLPRFVRMGDRATLSNRVVNTTSQVLSAQVTMQLLDAATEKLLLSEQKTLSLQPNETQEAAFIFAPEQLKAAGFMGDAVICRMTVSGATFSDGEQHLLPILSDEAKVVNTVAFMQTQAGTKTIALDALFPVKRADNHLLVKYTNHPAWLMIEALPSVASADPTDAIALAAKYFANTLSIAMLQKVGQTDSVAAMKRYQEEALFGLRQLQNADGSLAWMPGMCGSFYVTLSVAKMLQRLNFLLNGQTATQALLKNAMRFLAQEVKKQVAELRKAEARRNGKFVPNEELLQYLYIASLQKGKLTTPDEQYLLQLVAKQHNLFSIYGKAVMAVVLARNGNTALAKQHIESLKQYSVCTPEMGRYYDASRAEYSWFDYRIPTETAAIEALRLVTPGDKQTIQEMQQWLLQSKHTQQWDTPLNAVEAVYAFMDARQLQLLKQETGNAQLMLDGKPLEMTIGTSKAAVATAEKTGKTFGNLTVDKTSNDMSWGAVFAEFTQPLRDITAQSTGLRVKREVLTADGTAVNADRLKVGDRVKVRITLEASHDFDFVEVSDERAACLEPVNPLSGYDWGYYYMPGDKQTRYFFDQLNKGKHVIETEYFIDRKGEYNSGICTAKCAYSPEFSGRDRAIKLTNE